MLLKPVANKVIDYLNSPQFAQNQITSNIVKIQVPVKTWQIGSKSENKIENSNLVNQLNIESFNSDRVIISVNYPNSEIDIAEAFLGIGLWLNKTSDSYYTQYLPHNKHENQR